MIFAERTYDLASGGQVKLSLPEPFQSEEDGFWICRVKLEWPSARVFEITGAGVDKLQAFLHALVVARITLETSEEGQADGISWGDGNDLGLEVRMPENFEPRPRRALH